MNRSALEDEGTRLGLLHFPQHTEVTEDVKCHAGNPLLTSALTAVFSKMLTDSCFLIILNSNSMK